MREIGAFIFGDERKRQSEEIFLKIGKLNFL